MALCSKPKRLTAPGAVESASEQRQDLLTTVESMCQASVRSHTRPKFRKDLYVRKTRVWETVTGLESYSKTYETLVCSLLAHFLYLSLLRIGKSLDTLGSLNNRRSPLLGVATYQSKREGIGDAISSAELLGTGVSRSAKSCKEPSSAAW